MQLRSSLPFRNDLAPPVWSFISRVSDITLCRVFAISQLGRNLYKPVDQKICPRTHSSFLLTFKNKTFQRFIFQTIMLSQLICLAIGFYGGSQVAKNYEACYLLNCDNNTSDPSNEGRPDEKRVSEKDRSISERVQKAGDCLYLWTLTLNHVHIEMKYG